MKLNESKYEKSEGKNVADLLSENSEKEVELCKSSSKKEPFKLGDLVMVKTQLASTGESTKLEAKYRGPYVISRVLDNNRYIVEDLEGERQSNRLYKGILSGERLKFVSRPAE